MASQANGGIGLEGAEDEPQVRGRPLSEHVICFLSCPQEPGRGFLGALLLADFRARPLEFSYVAPVRPTPVQRILYGSALAEHVQVDVIAKKLLESIGRVPDVIFVNSRDLLWARRVAGVPVAFLAKSNAASATGSSLSTLSYDIGDRKSDEEIVGEIVGHLEPLIDLMEPFERIQAALKEVIKAGGAQV